MSKLDEMRDIYQNSSLPELVPVSVKRTIKKMIKPDSDALGVSYRNAAWMIKRTGYGKEKVKRSGYRRIKSDTIDMVTTYATRARRTEEEINRIVKKRYYRFEHMMVIKDPYYQVPLSAIIIFYTKEPCGVRYTVKGKTKKADYVQKLAPCSDHVVPVLGLYADYDNKVLIELLDNAGNTIKSRTISIRMRPLPGILLDTIKVGKHSADSAHPMMMISGGHNIRTVVFDEFGDIRFFLRRLTKAYGVFPISNSHMIYSEKWVDIPSYSVSQSGMIHDMDYLGRVHKTYFSRQGFHHCGIEKEEGGNLFIGSNSLDEHGEDSIIELDRETGETVQLFNLRDYFDDIFNLGSDYIHVNSVNYIKEDNSIIVSMRNIHSVCKFDYTTRELKWVICHPEIWKGTKVEDKVLKCDKDIRWPFQQHAAYQLKEDLDGNPDTIHVLLYDNHWTKRVPVDCYDDDEDFSYLSIYTINEKDMTVDLHKSFKVPNSRIRSNAILEYDKRRIFNHGADLIPPIDDNCGVVEEYDYDTGELLNQYFITPGYFTAYEFKPDIQALADSILSKDGYVCGDTIPVMPLDKRPDISNPKKLELREVEDEEDEEELPEEAYPGQFKKSGIHAATLMKDIDLKLQEDILFVKLIDHTVDYIYFLGNKADYYIDLTTTHQTNSKFIGKIYEVPFRLNSLKGGTYHIYYKYNGEIYDSEDEFTII